MLIKVKKTLVQSFYEQPAPGERTKVQHHEAVGTATTVNSSLPVCLHYGHAERCPGARVRSWPSEQDTFRRPVFLAGSRGAYQ